MTFASGEAADVPRRFTAEQVRQIRREFRENAWPTQLDAANHYDVSQSRISDIVTRNSYAWVPEE